MNLIKVGVNLDYLNLSAPLILNEYYESVQN